jgi:hypothetical protein
MKIHEIKARQNGSAQPRGGMALSFSGLLRRRLACTAEYQSATDCSVNDRVFIGSCIASSTKVD